MSHEEEFAEIVKALESAKLGDVASVVERDLSLGKRDLTPWSLSDFESAMVDHRDPLQFSPEERLLVLIHAVRHVLVDIVEMKEKIGINIGRPEISLAFVEDESGAIPRGEPTFPVAFREDLQVLLTAIETREKELR